MLNQTLSFSKLLTAALVITNFATPFIGSAHAKKDDVIRKLQLKSNDETGNEIKSVKAEYLIRKSEIKAINQLKSLIKKHKGKTLEAGLLFRLTELYMRRVKAERFFEVHRESNVVVALLPKIVKNASAKKYIKRSIKIYDYIMKKFPKYEQIDLVLFNNAFARQEIADYKNSEKIYWRIIKNHPDSDLIPDAHLAIGEIAFMGKRFKHALQHFKAIRKYPQSKVYPYGLYKSGWALYNLNQADDGIIQLEKVVKYSRKIASKTKKSNFNLLSEALRDLTIFYQEVYDAKDAYSYFAKITKPDELAEVLLSLSSIYKGHSKYDAVHSILNEFNQKNPVHETTPEVLDELAWNFESLRKRKKAEEYLVKLDKFCKKIKNEDCDERILDTSLTLGHKWRNLWVKNNKNELFGPPSETAFRIYLTRMPVNKESLDVRYLLSEMLFARNKFRDASDEYFTIAQNDTDKKRKHNSAYASIVSLQKATKDKWNEKDHAGYNKLAEFYLKTFKKGKYRLDVEFKVGLIPYEKNQFDIVKKIFFKLGNLYPTKEKGLKSQDLYLDILNNDKDYVAIKKYSKTLIVKSKDKKRSAELTKVYEQAYFLQIQGLEKANNYASAFTEYEKFTKENPKSLLASKALWNSALMQVKRKLPTLAAKQYEKFYKRYPSTPEAKDSLVQAANLYEEISDLKNSARVLVKLSKVDSKNNIKWKQVAAEYYYVEEDFNKSLNLFKELSSNQDDKVKFGAVDKIIMIIKNLKRKSKNIFQTKELMDVVYKNGNLNQKHFALIEKANGLYNKKKYAKAFKLAQNINKYSKDGNIKSQARFIQANVLRNELENQSLRTSIERVADVLSLKIERLDKAQNFYLKTIKYGNPENNAHAMYNLALCYKNYISSLQNMPTPRGLPEDQAEGFKDEIQTIISPIEDKYVETLHQAYITARKQHTYNLDLNNIRSELLKLKVSLNFENLSGINKPLYEYVDISRIPAGGGK